MPFTLNRGVKKFSTINRGGKKSGDSLDVQAQTFVRHRLVNMFCLLTFGGFTFA